ncbi:MAG: DUF11 domain-containing protein, partial [Candidatus Contendobacter sp.]|nr:DUF11 domain-containing protein [Candidatus Contendobacter sp.]MDG4558570.1 DUF11 domain-containing protein [Candidatus Contendobacter sp.]
MTKDNGQSTSVPGSATVYTVAVINAGPQGDPSVSVSDNLPTGLNCASWSSAAAGGATGNTVAGSGNIADTLNMPIGSSVTYTMNCTVASDAVGSLSNTVSATASVTDTSPSNNSATDTDTLTPQADLAITKTDGVTTATPGGSVTYTITASNAGPSNATGATVADTFPAALTCAWTCVGAGGGTCTAAGSGNINDTVNLPSGGSVTYTASCAVSASATGNLVNTATVAAPGGVTDPTPGNNSATDTDSMASIFDPPSGRKTVNAAGIPVLEWRMVWINNGNTTAN